MEDDDRIHFGSVLESGISILSDRERGLFEKGNASGVRKNKCQAMDAM